MASYLLEAVHKQTAYGMLTFNEARAYANIKHRVNQATGETVYTGSWITLIDEEDWDWFERFWLEEDYWDYYYDREMSR